MPNKLMGLIAVIVLVAFSTEVLSVNFGYFVSHGTQYPAIPPATSVEESKQYFSARRQRVLEHFARQTPPSAIVNRTTTREITDWATARILLGLDNFENGTPTATINNIILDAQSNVFAPYGSSANDVPGCDTKGDYDFAAMNLIRLAYSEKRKPGYLSPEAYRKLAVDLLPRTGKNKVPNFEVGGFCGDLLDLLGIKLSESENHVLMMEIARYLSNQLRQDFPEFANDPYYDNEAQGNHHWMLNHLRRFLNGHFEEYNSRPYQGFTVLALNVLHSYAENEDVKRAALNVLDYITAFSVVQQNGLRREVAFRRQPKYEAETRSYEGDGEMERMALLTGNYHYLEPLAMTLPPGDGQRHFILTAAATDYYPHDILLALAVDKGHNPYYQVARHDNIEMYSSTGAFLISSGGKFDAHEFIAEIFGDNTQHGWARPTVLIPTKGTSSDYRDYIRFLGHRERKKRNNTCVGPGFACGVDLRVPSKYEACVETVGSWRFYNLTVTGGCALDYGFYLALQNLTCTSSTCRDVAQGDNYGFLEAQPSQASSFDTFKSTVLANNAGQVYTSEGVSRHITTSGKIIQFEINPAEGKTSILSVDNAFYDRSGNWPRARGDVIQVTTPYRFAIDSPATNQRLILDMNDAAHPRRFMTERPTVHHSLSFGGTGGRYFNDGDSLTPNSQIQSIELRAGERLDALRIYYNNGLATSRGGNGGTSRWLHFQAGEYIQHVEISTAKNGDQVGYLRLETNYGQVLEGGVRGSEVNFHAPQGTKIIGFHGHSGGEIDRLGVIYSPLFPGDALPDFPIFIKTIAYGDNGGHAFDGSAYLSSSTQVSRLVVRAGNRVDNIGIDYADGTSFRHGGTGGTETHFDMQAGEYLSKVYVSTVRKNGSRRISSFRIVTSFGRHWVKGKERSLQEFAAPPGWHIVGFHGRAGKEVDKLGAIFAPLPKMP